MIRALCHEIVTEVALAAHGVGVVRSLRCPVGRDIFFILFSDWQENCRMMFKRFPGVSVSSSKVNERMVESDWCHSSTWCVR